MPKPYYKVGDIVRLKDGFEGNWVRDQALTDDVNVERLTVLRHYQGNRGVWYVSFEEFEDKWPQHNTAATNDFAWVHTPSAPGVKYVGPPGVSEKPVDGDTSQRGTDAKWDKGKPMFDLLDDDCPQALLGVVQVMSWAVEHKGYLPGSWQTVPEAIKRYGAAMRRHQNAKARGERYDIESGLLHDFHIATNAIFVAELEARLDIANTPA